MTYAVEETGRPNEIEHVAAWDAADDDFVSNMADIRGALDERAPGLRASDWLSSLDEGADYDRLRNGGAGHA